MTYQIATILSCALFPLFGWLGLTMAKRTIVRGVLSDEGAQRNEEAERQKVRDLREKNVKKLFTIYGVIVVVLFLAAALAVPAKKVQAALWPSATPTITLTRTPTITRTPTNTPRPTNTRAENNFLTTISTTGTITGTVKPATLIPSGGGGGGGVVIVQTRIVVQTHIVAVTQMVTQIVYYPVTVFVTSTFTPLPSSETATVTQTVTPTPTFTATPTVTVTATHIPTITPTETETQTP